MTRYRFSPMLTKALFQFGLAGGGPVHLKNVDLTPSQRKEFWRLQYWWLVDKCPGKPGVWKMNEEGWEFLRGQELCATFAVVQADTERIATSQLKGNPKDSTKYKVVNFEGPVGGIEVWWPDFPHYIERSEHEIQQADLARWLETEHFIFPEELAPAL